MTIRHFNWGKIYKSAFKAYLLFCALWVSWGHAGSLDQSINGAKLRIHYPDTTQSQCNAVLMGVGTAMQAKSYDKLGKQIIKHGHIFIAVDHAPGNMVKTDANKYKSAALMVKDELLSWLPSLGCNTIDHWVMGGHSAGGQAAQNAVANTVGLADAIFSIDPYNARDTNPVHVPALYWGFDKTTCFVEIDDAAKEAYYRSHGKRAFYQVNTRYSWGPCGYSPKYFHCSFCDGHCPACTNCQLTPDHFFVDVANSLDRFLTATFEGPWSKTNLQFSSTTPLTLYVDSEQP